LENSNIQGLRHRWASGYNDVVLDRCIRDRGTVLGVNREPFVRHLSVLRTVDGVEGNHGIIDLVPYKLHGVRVRTGCHAQVFEHVVFDDGGYRAATKVNSIGRHVMNVVVFGRESPAAIVVDSGTNTATRRRRLNRGDVFAIAVEGAIQPCEIAAPRRRVDGHRLIREHRKVAVLDDRSRYTRLNGNSPTAVQREVEAVERNVVASDVDDMIGRVN